MYFLRGTFQLHHLANVPAVGEEGDRESHNNPTEFFLPYTPAAAYIYLKTGLFLSGPGL